MAVPLVALALSSCLGPVDTSQPPPMSLSGLVTSTHSCGLTSAGAAWCWGNSASGQLGYLTLNVTAERIPVPVQTNIAFVKLAAGARHTCGLDADGLAWCWGENVSGQLGDNTTTTRVEPAPVEGGLQFTDIDAGAAHTCGLTAIGDIYCWGSGTYGQLGNGTFAASEPLPVKAAVANFQALSLGENLTCGLAGGQAWCWGLNGGGGSGWLGQGTTPPTSSLPLAVSGGHSFVSLTVGAAHTCALTAAGIAWCWGYNDFRQVTGDSSNAKVTTPVAVSTTLTFKQIAPGTQHTCALTTDGTPWCWGFNTSGALGDATKAARYAPVAVVGGINFNRIASDQHTCGEATDGIAYCWGKNDFGQLGDGLLASRPGPAPVRKP